MELMPCILNNLLVSAGTVCSLRVSHLISMLWEQDLCRKLRYPTCLYKFGIISFALGISVSRMFVCLVIDLATWPRALALKIWQVVFSSEPSSPPSFPFHVSGIGLCDLKVVGHWPQRKELSLGKELKAAKFNSHLASTMLEILYQHEDHTTMEKY